MKEQEENKSLITSLIGEHNSFRRGVTAFCSLGTLLTILCKISSPESFNAAIAIARSVFQNTK